METHNTPPGLEVALCKAYEDEAVTDCLHTNPYGLFAIVMTQWHVWNVRLFYTLEQDIKDVEERNSDDDPPKFKELYRISRRVIRSVDVCKAVIEIQRSLPERHKALLSERREGGTDYFSHVEPAIEYHNNAFIGTYWRMKNLEKRINLQIEFV